MGVFDIFKPRRSEVQATRTALEEANEPGGDDSGAITKLIQKILELGIDGRGPFPGAVKVADRAMAKSDDKEEAVDRVARSHIGVGGVGGFVTSLGGFITMPIALPANILEFYVLATRMVAAMAKLRGYNVNQQEIRSAVLLTLIGSRSEEILTKAGVTVGGGRLAGLAFRKLPAAAIMVINKAVGFRLLRSAGTKTLSRFGRAVPIVGGIVGGAVDGYMMHRIADQARREFPATKGAT